MEVNSTLLIVGLGNPGKQYEKTRHNLGFLAVKALARKLGWDLREDKRFHAETAKGIYAGTMVHLLLPMTYMNLSGNAVRKYVDYYKIPYQRLLVVCDDTALPFEQIRLKLMGSAGGHNGLKSVESLLGTSHYARLRMGVSEPGERIRADYVLEPFSPAEQLKLESYVDAGVQALLQVAEEGFTRTMTRVNAKNELNKPPKNGVGEHNETSTKKPLRGDVHPQGDVERRCSQEGVGSIDGPHHPT